MNTLIEVAEYVEEILRLDLTTEVRGYDGKDNGPSNEQAQTLANRTKWLKSQVDTLVTELKALGDRPYVASVNSETGDITLTYSDVGAAPTSHTHGPSDVITTDDAQFVSSTEKKTWNAKQDKLESGKTLKTLLGLSLLGEGNIILKSGDITTSDDAQFVSKDEKTLWNSKQDKLVSGENIVTLYGNALLGKGDITLSYNDVGSDKSGAAEDAIKNHVAEKDPHTQYLNNDRGDARYVTLDTANQPNGYLKLTEQGYFPPEIAELYQVRYLVPADKTERLAIDPAAEITICLQADNNTVYYLEGNKDPSVEDNWKEGQSVLLDPVVSIFGRAGVVTAKAGDYNTNLITETSEKTFVSSTDRTNWNSKQDALVSGTNIKTINSETLLGKTDIVISPLTIGAATKVHTHNPSDIKTTNDAQFVSSTQVNTWDAKQDALISGTNIKTVCEQDIIGKGNVNLTYSDVGAAPTAHKHSPDDIETDSSAQFVSTDEKTTWNSKQDKLESGKSIKTINNQSLLDSGNIAITPDSIGAATKEHTHAPSDIKTTDDAQFVSKTQKDSWTNKQDGLISGKNLSTVFGQSLLTGYNISIGDADNFATEVNSTLKGGNAIRLSFNDEDKTTTIDWTDTSLIGGDYTFQDVSDMIPNQSVRFPIPRLEFNNSTRVYRESAVYAPATVNIDYTTTAAGLLSTPITITPDETGGFPSGDPYTAVYNETSTGPEKYITDPISYDNLPERTDRLNIATEDKTADVIPIFDRNDVTGNFSLSSSKIYSTTYNPWKAFQTPLTEDQAKNISSATYWSDGDYFKDTVGEKEVYLAISNPDGIALAAYGFQRFTKFVLATSTPPTAWDFQGRNSDDEEWTTFDSQTDQLITEDGAYDWLVYRLARPVFYKQIRILINAVVKPDGARASIPRLQFYTYTGTLLKDKDDKYLTVASNGQVSEVTINDPADFNTYIFSSTPGLVNIAEIKSRFPIRLCEFTPGTTVIKPYRVINQLTTQTLLNQQGLWYGLNNIVVSDTFDDLQRKEIKIALTVDGSEYYIYNEKWVSIGTLNVDEASADSLVEKGMSIDTFEAITGTQWNDLITKITQPKLGIVFARTLPLAGRKSYPKTMLATVDEKSGWEVISLDDVVVTFDEEYVTFTVNKAGNYKFGYKY